MLLRLGLYYIQGRLLHLGLLHPSEQIKYYQAAHNTNIVIADSANQNVEGQVNQGTHKSLNAFEHNAYSVEAKTRLQDRQATRACHYCANCHSETTLRKYADSQRQLRADTHQGFCSRSMLQGHGPGAKLLRVYQRFHGQTSSSGAEFPPHKMLHDI